ncbi:MAG: type IX secretion system membrane protein PorP/SprF, partial [Planctomycetota bacterium]
AYKSVNINALTFESQYTSYNGGGFDNTLQNGESNLNNSVFIPDLNAGLLYYYAKSKSRFNPFIGFTGFHLTSPKESFFSESNRLPIRFLVHGGCKVNVSDKIQLVPKFLLMQQVNDREIAGGLDLNYYLPNTTTFVILGSSYRNKDAIICFAGLKYGRVTYKVSYDINNSSLQPATGGRGGFEISFTLIGSRYKPTPIPNCPRPI